MDLALGLIETKGLVGAIEAADAMAKAADVKIISKEKVTGALIIIKIMGETAAVKASIDAGSAAAQRVGDLVSAHVIPRPDDQIDKIIFNDPVLSDKKKVTPKKNEKDASSSINEKLDSKNETMEVSAPRKAEKVVREKDKQEKSVVKKADSSILKHGKKVPPMDELVILNVHALRRIARSFDDFPIKGRDISKANRAKLLDHFKSMQ
jgi:ethanolamine utilization protein EutM